MRRLSLVEKIAAYLLVTLTVLPFTAPLAACPLGDFLSAGPLSAAHHGPFHTPSEIHRAALNHTLPISRVSGRHDAAAIQQQAGPALAARRDARFDDWRHGGSRSSPPLIALRI